MNIVSAYTDAMRRYVGFGGRSSRSQYWFFILIAVGGTILLLFLPEPVNGWTAGIFAVVHFLPLWAVSVRRLHDFDASGFWLLLYFLIGGLVIIGIGCISPTEGDNHYGRPPHLKDSDTIAKAFD